MNKIKQLLGGLSYQAFLKKYWQKEPLLIRNAIPGFTGFLTKNDIIRLSYREEVSTRLVQLNQNRWSMDYGPFKRSHFKKLNPQWTLLIQEINHFYSEGSALLNTFNFIPYTRLDDVMVSYATNLSGVGPHFDSYDVFLLQGYGQRLWQISNQKDLSLLPNIPLRILKNFIPTQEWILNPGDMLYLPPHYAHNGIAIGESITYSIGFRSPSYKELINEFLFYLQDTIQIDGIYSDPDLRTTRRPAYIPDDMVNKISEIFKLIRFDKKEIKRFLGKYLTEPKPHSVFYPPDHPFSKNKFIGLTKKHGLHLNLQSRMLFTNGLFYLNGEEYYFSQEKKHIFQKLANQNKIFLSISELKLTEDIFYDWYLNGYIDINSAVL